MHSIGVIGAGAWGTALAQAFATGGRNVLIWAREPEVAESINTTHENTVFLKGIPLDPRLKATTNLREIAQRDILLLVTPAQHIRATLSALKPDLSDKTILVICAKGIELESGKLLSDICKELLPANQVAVLTGPTFASEVAKGLPCAVTIGTSDKNTGLILQEALGVKHFRPYITDDIIGSQLGGAIKNVIAIACGIVYGQKLGESARAALLTRGVAEISRLAEAMGARQETLLGLCGIGDLMLTASSMQSRNFSLGAALGEGQSMEEILKQRNAVTEGVHTAQSTLALARKYNVEMPVTEAVYKCLHQNVSIPEAMEELLNRPLKPEAPEKTRK
ncbi:MAG: NAD(P)-dependent glycerol-3-phosphate dehydrogenase [Alphaproteobacteria bacterium]|nr:NAD(P)-dependent glycerol-3-phosphate dehydrogenase [Alphaproteobacteria bacterium]